MGEPKTAKKISASFFQNDKGKMPVREWILGFSPDDKKIIGEDIKTAEFGWPVGMPVVKPIGDKLYEVRSSLSDGSEARILFTIYKNYMVLLHGFIKKTQKIQKRELNLARNRMKKFFKNEKFK
jgi:phage-related protein